MSTIMGRKGAQGVTRSDYARESGYLPTVSLALLRFWNLE